MDRPNFNCIKYDTQTEIEDLRLYIKDLNEYVNFLEKQQSEQLILPSVVNCVYAVTERDNYGEQLLKQVFANRVQAVEYLKEQGLTETNIYEINEIELD